jgi:radical SAM superfamily enzyme YgiQ (UPF0313 family)
MMAERSGVKVVLTASAVEMSDFYDNPFVAFVGGFTKGPLPLWLVRKVLYPPIGHNGDGRVRYAPYGLRKVEAILLANGFDESEIAVAHPSDLDDFVGPQTKVVGISTMDPLGMGYVSKTYSSLVGGGEPINAIEFRKLMRHSAIMRYRPKIIVGGFGAWQLERQKTAERYGVDSVVIGAGANAIAEVFRKAVNGEVLPRVVRVNSHSTNGEIPLIKHASIHGCVEISRGCGRNCQFCTPTMQRKHDIPIETIMKEVEVNVKEGNSAVTLVTEDLFLYGTKDKRFIPNREAVVKLVKNVASFSGVKSIQTTHTSLAPVVHNPDMIKEVAEILIERPLYHFKSQPMVTSEVGLETGSVRLMRKYMCGKMLPFKPEQWKEVAAQSFGIMNDNDWYPLATLITGLPEENEADVIETLELVDDLKNNYLFYVPLLFVPLENCALMDKQGAELDSLSKRRWELLIRCWEYNVRVWRGSFLEHRISNPLVYSLVDKAVIPLAGKIAGTYYGFKRGKIFGDAISKIAQIES